MKLCKSGEIVLTPTSPFDFDSTFHKPDHFASQDNDWQPGTRWQTWRWLGTVFGLRFENQGSIEKPQVIVSVYSTSHPDRTTLNTLQDEFEYRYNLKLDLTDFYSKFAKDKDVGPVIFRWRGMRPGHQSSLYEYLNISIVLQNCTVKRSIQMMQTLYETYGTRVEFDGKRLWSFWEPGELSCVSEDELRSLKLGYRAKSIKRIDEAFALGLVDEMDLRAKDRDIQMKELMKLYGVGPATVWYLLFDVFHHYDFFNHISPWEQKIYSKLFFDTDPEEPVPTERLLQHFEKFGEYKQLAVHYIWEDLWWKRTNEHIPWLEKLVRV